MFGSFFRGWPICFSHEQSDRSLSFVMHLSSLPFSSVLLQALVFTCVPHYNTASGTWQHSGRRRFAPQLRPDLVQWVGGGGGGVSMRIRGVEGGKKKQKNWRGAGGKHMGSVCMDDNGCIRIQWRHRLCACLILPLSRWGREVRRREQQRARGREERRGGGGGRREKDVEGEAGEW